MRSAFCPGQHPDPEQTQYYFLSGFTSKLAGTERGITEPTPTFSACFGQAFLELHPTKYAEELVKKMQKSGAKAYLVTLLTRPASASPSRYPPAVIDASPERRYQRGPHQEDPALRL